MEWITHVYDCKSNLIFIDQHIVNANKDKIDLWFGQYLRIVEVILTPALIFELNRKCRTRYYYSAVKSLRTPVLIGVHFTNGIWKVKEYIEIPSVSFLLTLIKQHLQDGAFTIYIERAIDDNALGNMLAGQKRSLFGE